MKLVGRLLAYLSVLVNMALGLVLLGMGLIGSGSDMKVNVIPASPEAMPTVLVFAGLGALVAAILALRPGRVSRSFLVLWCLLVAGILVCAFTRSSYRFDGEDHFRMGVYVFLGALLLLWGAYSHWRNARRVSAGG